MAHLGLQISGFSYPGVSPEGLFDKVAEVAVAAEEAGFDSLWVMDHFHQLPMLGGADEPILEAYTTLGALAGRTTTAQLGTLVTGVTYRNPALLAKIVTTLDVVSRGRAILGIGAAWFEEEHRAYGWEFPPAGERLDRLEEALRVCKAMFTQEAPRFEGRHYRIKGAGNVPRPVRAGGPPIMVGGSGEKRTLRLVARYADMCNVFGDAGTVRHKVAVLEKHCSDVGRDPSEIVKTALATLVIAPTHEEAEAKKEAFLRSTGMPEERAASFALFGAADRVTEQVAVQRDAGLDGVIVNLPDAHEPDLVALAAEALRAAF